MSKAFKPVLLTQPERARALPRLQRTRDLALPIVVALSLMVHATVLIPLLFQEKKTAIAAPTEIPVEIIQEPAKPPPREASKPPPPPPPVAKQEPKQDQPKQDQPKQDQPKQKQPKPPRQDASKPEQKSPGPAKQAESQARVAERMRKLLGQTPSLDPIVLPGESANGTEGASYEQLVISKLTKTLSFERRRGPSGYAVVTFVLDDHGEVASVTIDRPSGDAGLDSEALAAIRRGAPYPAPPPGGKRDYTVTLESRPIL